MMDRDDRPQTDAAAAGSNVRRLSLYTVACGLLVVGASVTAGHLIGCMGRVPEDAAPPPSPPSTVYSSKPLPPYLFRGWPDRKPDLALVITGQQHSYLKFCGCSEKQLGGLERRYNFLGKLKEKGWPVAAVDLGDLVMKQARGAPADQLLLKYETTMKALEVMGYTAVGLGEHDFNLPLEQGLSRFTLQKPDAYPYVLCANLSPESKQFFPLDNQCSLIRGTAVTGGVNGAPKMGVMSVAGASLTDRNLATGQRKILAPEMKFLDNGQVIPQALQAFSAAGVELRVLLYQGSLNEAKSLAGAIPQFHVIVCLSEEEEPSGDPVRVGDTLIIGVGHKARYVGVLGAYRTGKADKPVQVHYQLVALDEDLETDAGKEAGHPILALLDDYAQRVRDEKLMQQFSRNPPPNQPKAQFIGSDKCQMCHPAEYAKWTQTHHSHAYDDLAQKAHKPSLRQYDGECVVCHTVGFEYAGGYKNERETPQLKNVGCENCHGPGSLHAGAPQHKPYHASLSPWKQGKPDARLIGADGKWNNAVLLNVDQMCQKCHDTDNDPNYSKPGNRFEGYWPKIAHGKSPQLRP